MSEPSLQKAQEQLKDVACAVCLCPKVPADLAEELRQIYFTLRNHAFFMTYVKRQLDELSAEFGSL